MCGRPVTWQRRKAVKWLLFTVFMGRIIYVVVSEHLGIHGSLLQMSNVCYFP